jgi:uncharacterized protein
MKKKEKPEEKNKDNTKVKVSNNDKIKELEQRITDTKYNKKTQHAIGLYKAQIAKLKQKQEARSSVGKGSSGYSVRKTGDATVVLLGYPSVGKSSILNKITNAKSPVGNYAFTTLDVIPGVLKYKHAKIQILDVPGVVAGAASGRGRGKEVLAVIRNADLIMIILDSYHPEHYKSLQKEINDTGVRINQEKPIVKIVKKSRGGINIGSTLKLDQLDNDTIKSILMEFKLNNVDIVIRTNINADQLIDAIEANKSYVPALIIANKADLLNEKTTKEFTQNLGIEPDLFISANTNLNMDILKEKIFNKLNFMRIYLKEIGKKPDMKEPIIMIKGNSIKDVCIKLHKDFLTKFKSARVWGTSAKFDAQKIVKTEHVLQDNDVLEIHLR